MIELVIRPEGDVEMIYDERLDVRAIGTPTIRRASHVETTDNGDWMADLSPVGGPVLGPFAVRSEALQAEHTWILGWLQTSVADESRV